MTFQTSSYKCLAVEPPSNPLEQTKDLSGEAYCQYVDSVGLTKFSVSFSLHIRFYNTKIIQNSKLDFHICLIFLTLILGIQVRDLTIYIKYLGYRSLKLSLSDNNDSLASLKRLH